MKLGKWSPGFLFGVAIAGWPAVTRAESIWLPLTHTATASSQVSLSAAYHQGIVPRFRLSERDVRQLSVEGMTRPHEQILCYMHLPATPSALGELTLGTRADLVTRTRWAAGLGWWAYVPLLADANEMSGGGELGVGFASHLDAQWQDTTLTVFIGLDIRGDPLRPFGQDDIPLSWLQVKHPIGQNLLHVRGGGGWRTARNPARQQLTAGLQRPLARTWWVGAEGTIGLSPAAVDHGGRLWFSWRQAEG